MSRKFSVLFVIYWLMSGCHGDRDSSTEKLDVELNGIWKTNCLETTFFEIRDTPRRGELFFQIISYGFDNGLLHASNSFFYGSDCQDLAIGLVDEADYAYEAGPLVITSGGISVKSLYLTRLGGMFGLIPAPVVYQFIGDRLYLGNNTSPNSTDYEIDYNMPLNRQP